MDNQSKLLFQVSDEGIGMEDMEKEKLKQLFEIGLAEKKISKNTAGFGMGLYISNLIVKELSKG